MDLSKLFASLDFTLDKQLEYKFKENYIFLKNNFISKTDIYYNKDLLNKLNIINEDKQVNHNLVKTKTHLGKFYLFSKINSPTDCVNKLNFNKECIKCISDKKKYNHINTKLNDLKKIEYSLVSLFDESYTKNSLFEPLYFSDILEKLNNNVHILNSYTLFNIHYAKYYILSPIIIIIIPIILSKCLPSLKFLSSNFLFKCIQYMSPSFDIFNCKNITDIFVNVVYILFFMYNSYTALKLSKHVKVVYNHIKTHLLDLNKLVKWCHNVYNFENIGLLLKISKLPKIESIILQFNKLEDDIYGNTLILFKECIRMRDEFIPYIKFIGFIDYLVSINTLINECNYSIADYIYQNNEPNLEMKDLNHPFIKNSVSNTISLNNTQKNYLITGPNTSGKSTLIKTVLLNIFLAQTIGISKSSNIILTPFSNLDCFINNTDTLGKQSFFETEIKNILDYIKKIEAFNNDKISNKKKFGFVIIDEILNGTNRKDSISVSYALCKKLFKYQNSMALVTTHQNYLGYLEKNSNVKNYKMNINYNKIKNKYINTYKLKPGISDVYLGIDVLKKNGVSDDIIKEAEKIKKIVNN